MAGHFVLGFNATLSEDPISCSPYQSDACNCVTYARARTGGALPTGCTTCADKQRLVNSKVPKKGCVMFRTGDPTYCHAAFVTGTDNGNTHFDQANWTPCKCSHDYMSSASSAIIGYWCP